MCIKYCGNGRDGAEMACFFNTICGVHESKKTRILVVLIDFLLSQMTDAVSDNSKCVEAVAVIWVTHGCGSKKYLTKKCLKIRGVFKNNFFMISEKC